jgi:glycogen(starch) synthase
MLEVRQRLTRLKRDFQPDLVHINLTDPSVLFHWQTLGLNPAATLVSTRVALPSKPAGEDSLMGQTLRSADWVTTISKAMLEYIHRISPETKGHSSLVYNGLDMPELPPGTLPFEKPRLLCLGRLVEDKGFDVALRAFKRIVESVPEARLLIGGDGPSRPKLEELATDLEISNLVEFMGWVRPSRVYELINTATVVLMPSRWEEAFGLVALQAAQMARPVVATRVGGLPEVVIDNETGLLVPNEDHSALSGAVIWLLTNKRQAVRMGENARTRAKDVFNWTSYIDQYDSLYNKLINMRRKQ